MVKFWASWGDLIAECEGRASTIKSVRIVDGRPCFWIKAAAPDEVLDDPKPNLAPLVELLRSGEALPDEIREWLAGALDPNGKSGVRLEPVYRKNSRPKGRKINVSDAAARFVHGQMLDNVPRKNAIADAIDRYGIKPRAIESALKRLNEAIDAHDAATRENK